MFCSGGVGMNFTVSSHTSLDDDTRRELEALVQRAGQHDSVIYSAYYSGELNYDQTIPFCSIARRGDGIIVGFLLLFLPSSTEIEISAWTDPKWRALGVFTALMKSLISTIYMMPVGRILFLHQNGVFDGAAVFKHYALEPEFSEYLMRYDEKLDKTPGEKKETLTIGKARAKDLETLAHIHSSAFGTDYAESKDFLSRTLTAKTITVFIALLHEEPVGMCCLSHEEETLSIFSLAVAPDFQGRGMGKRIVRSVLNYRNQKLNQRPITLEVGSLNAKAYNLYLHSGFGVVSQTDYYPVTKEWFINQFS